MAPPSTNASVRAAAPISEDPENIALFEDMAREMAADPWSGWKTELAERGSELGVSQPTFDRVLADLDRASAHRASLSLEVDKSAIESFFVGHICQLRLRLVNEGSRGLKALRLRWATTSCNGIKEEQSRPVGPSRDAVLTASIRPRTPGQHVFEGVVTATDYGRKESHFSFRSITFQVAEKTDGPQTVINQTTVDFGGVRAADQSGMTIGGGASAPQASGRLMVDGDWVVIRLSPMSKTHAEAWQKRNQEDSVPQAEGATVESPAPAPQQSTASVATPTPPTEEPVSSGPPDLPAGKYHYAGPSGRSQLSPDEVRFKIRQNPDESHKVWKDGWAQWKPWGQVPELMNALPRTRSNSNSASQVTNDGPGQAEETPQCTEVQAQARGSIEIELVDGGKAGSKLIRLVCEGGEMSLGDAVKAVNSPPFTFARVASSEEAEAIISRVAGLGAVAQVKGQASRSPRATAGVDSPSRAPVQPRSCPSCGRTNLGKAPFCMSCGSAMRSSRAHSAASSAASTQPSTFGVRLSGTGTSMIQLMAIVREATGKGTAETRRMLSALPCVLSSGLSEEDAQRLAERLGRAGGAAEVVRA